MAAVGRLEDTLPARIRLSDPRERRATGPCAESGICRCARLRGDILHLARGAIETGHLAAVNDVRVERIGRDIAIFLDADGVPLAESDLAIVAAADDAGRAAFLLAAVDPVRELIVGDDMVKLRGRLVVPRTPGLPAVDGDDGALIAATR